MQKRRKGEDNIERYEREKRSTSVMLGDTSQTPQPGKANNMDKSFLNKYINLNKLTLSSDVNRFPSIEARRKYTNEYSPTLVDTK